MVYQKVMNNVKQIHYYIIGMLAILFMGACSSGRKLAKPDYAEAPASVWKADECVTAKANIRLRMDKDKGMSIGGNLRMKRDDVIILNATYLFGMQIGTMELTPETILVVSRYTRQYIRMTYPELSALLGREVTFRHLQSIFWGEAGEFRVQSVEWDYGSFMQMEDGRRLPASVEITFAGGGASMEMTLALSKYKYETGWNTRTSFNEAGYERLSPELLKKMMTILLTNK